MHYPGWEARWDEWVTRDRLRWGNERRADVLKGIAPSEGDSVEMWCEGVHVPGAWLEADVHAVEDGRLYLGEVRNANERDPGMFVTGPLWFPRLCSSLSRCFSSCTPCMRIRRD